MRKTQITLLLALLLTLSSSSIVGLAQPKVGLTQGQGQGLAQTPVLNLAQPLVGLAQPKVGLAQRPVEQYYEVPRFTSQTTNTWSNYGDLNKTFFIPSQGYVDISYGISGEVNGTTGHIVTRVLVDGKERKEFRGISGYSKYVHVSVFNRVSLLAGNHSIVLQYRTAQTINADFSSSDKAGRFMSLSDSDWRVGYLKVIY